MSASNGLAADRKDVLRRHGVSRETAARLDVFVSLLAEWQDKTNLIAPSTLPLLWTRHIEDSLQLSVLAEGPLRWVDLGSGAGFPGLVTAILNHGRADAHVDLIESNDKKAAFLRAVIRATGVAAKVHAARIEDCARVLAGAQAISARALAPLDTLFGFVAGHIAREIPCFFPKGRQHAQETVDASRLWRFTMITHASSVEPGSVILEVRDIERHRVPPQ